LLYFFIVVVIKYAQCGGSLQDRAADAPSEPLDYASKEPEWGFPAVLAFFRVVASSQICPPARRASS